MIYSVRWSVLQAIVNAFSWYPLMRKCYAVFEKRFGQPCSTLSGRRYFTLDRSLWQYCRTSVGWQHLNFVKTLKSPLYVVFYGTTGTFFSKINSALRTKIAFTKMLRVCLYLYVFWIFGVRDFLCAFVVIFINRVCFYVKVKRNFGNNEKHAFLYFWRAFIRVQKL